MTPCNIRWPGYLSGNNFFFSVFLDCGLIFLYIYIFLPLNSVSLSYIETSRHIVKSAGRNQNKIEWDWIKGCVYYCVQIEWEKWQLPWKQAEISACFPCLVSLFSSFSTNKYLFLLLSVDFSLQLMWRFCGSQAPHPDNVGRLEDG